MRSHWCVRGGAVGRWATVNTVLLRVRIRADSHVCLTCSTLLRRDERALIVVDDDVDQLTQGRERLIRRD